MATSCDMEGAAQSSSFDVALARGATSAAESRLRLKPHHRCRKLAQQWLGCCQVHSRKSALQDISAPQRDLNVVLCCAQAQLLDSLFGTERGLSASSEVRAEINELITQLEAKSPTTDLSEVMPAPDAHPQKWSSV